jgi:undecaprenyl-phosphate 4-deoxy-4-formamido-L-arabinose transferase
VEDLEELETPHTVSVVIPVYHGEHTLAPLLEEIARLTSSCHTPAGNPVEVAEVVLVYDNGSDQSDTVMRRLAKEYDFVRTVWLSRNFGQHAATLAGMASTGSDWIVTMDEDGQHNPADILPMLDTALTAQAPLVYAAPTNPAPHGIVRNAASRTAKWVFAKVLAEGDVATFSSFRLVLGELGRSVAAYCGSGVYLDVALSWVVGRTAMCDVRLRREGDRRSGYSFRRLLSHFWRLVLSSGTRPLRLVSVVGFLMASVGFVLALVLVIRRILHQVTVAGWTSVIVTVLVGVGVLLVAVGLVAEYVSVSVKMAMGRPLYLISTDPANTALGRAQPRRDDEIE